MSDRLPTTPPPGAPRDVPSAVRIVAALGIAYALVAVGAAVYVLVLLRDGVGGLAAAASDRFVLRGAVMLILALLIAAAALAVGARRLLGGRGALMLAIPLAIVVVVGTVGEIADSIGGVDGRSLLIGLGIIVAAGVPLLLLGTRGARNWIRS
ncbi:hypothetical protein Q6346_07850 [Isoptericola sp. b490]|uniref:hypothetical protein n=1 Tax=Actinotalea lenta TaxID=3064654 RepID=UPI0027124D1A|nr:hypothetical protein [Isoptericola sp. b490]MDO8121223.1 hypothetical protein [Isoptericola sp. b490]